MKPLFYSARPNTPWKVEIPESISGGKRLRRFFATEELAKAFIAETKLRVRALGAQAFVDEDQPVDGYSVSALADMFLARKSAEYKGDYIAALKTHLKRIKAKWGEFPARALTAHAVDQWLQSLELAPTSRFNVFKVMRTFFAWADQMDFVPSSIMRKVPAPRKGEPAKVILSVQQMMVVLRDCLTRKDFVVFPALCLGGFAGLRTVEILKLQWTDIDWKGKEIHVRPGVQKRTRGAIRERYVAILPALEAWLKPHAKKDGPVIPLTEKYFREHRKKLARKIKFQDWPDNCLRHSFGSYHMAMWQDAGKTAYQMGHADAQMVHRHYARATKKDAAEAWWALSPKTSRVKKCPCRK